MRLVERREKYRRWHESSARRLSSRRIALPRGSRCLRVGECEKAKQTEGPLNLEDDATSGGPREDSASGSNFERPPTARSAESASDSETEGALWLTHESKCSRCNSGEAARSRRGADEPNCLPSLEPAESGQLARAAELCHAASGFLQTRVEDVHAWCDRTRGRRGEAGKSSESADRDGEACRNARHARPNLLRIVSGVTARESVTTSSGVRPPKGRSRCLRAGVAHLFRHSSTPDDVWKRSQKESGRRRRAPKVERTGIEPVTFGLQSRRSPS